MRIAFVTETWYPSTDGVVTRLTATVRELARMGHEILILAPRPAPPTFEGIPVRSVPTAGLWFIAGGRPWGLPVPQVLHDLGEFHPDVVHVVNPFVVGIAGVVYARRYGVPLVASYHTNVAAYAAYYHMGFAQGAIWALLRALHNRADVNLVTSDTIRRDVESHGIERVQVWQRGVDTRFFHPSKRSPDFRKQLCAGDPARPLVMYVGRLAPEKGLDRLGALFDTDLPVNLAFVGDGPERPRLEDLFRNTPTRFTGMLSGENLASAYAAADLFGFPSTTDTLGLVVLEAMASGVPILAADAGPSHEMLDRCGAGFFFDPSRPVTMAEALLPILKREDPVAELGSLGRRAREEAERHSWTESTRQVLGIYEHVRLGRRGQVPA